MTTIETVGNTGAPVLPPGTEIPAADAPHAANADRPMVTFAVFAYNQERYIREALEGAFAQTYRPLEIILSDDCSTDHTFEIIQEMAAAYQGPHEVKVRRNEVNVGTALHLSLVAAASSGALIVVAAGDDISMDHRTTELVSTWRRAGSPVAITHSAAYFFQDGTSPKSADLRVPKLKLDTPAAVERAASNRPFHLFAQTFMYSRDLFDRFQPLLGGSIVEDGPMIFRCIYIGQFLYSRNAAVYVRVSPDTSGTNLSLSRPAHWNRLFRSRFIACNTSIRDMSAACHLSVEDRQRIDEALRFRVNWLGRFVVPEWRAVRLTERLRLSYHVLLGRAYRQPLLHRVAFMCRSIFNSTISIRWFQRRLAAVRRPAGKLRAALRRARLWRMVHRNLVGATRDDAAVLRRAILLSPTTVWRNLHRWQFPMVDKDCTVVAKGVGTFRVRAHTDDLFHALPNQEPAVERVVRARLRAGDTFVDAGANIGYYTILASRLVGASGRVTAVEMMSDTAAILRDHVKMNGAENVRIVEAALCDRHGDGFALPGPQGKSGQARIASDPSASAVRVTSTTLNDILADVPCVALMKLDVEGVEVLALQGAGSALKRIKAIVFEAWGPQTDASEFLERQGYRIEVLDGSNKLAVLGEA